MAATAPSRPSARAGARMKARMRMLKAPNFIQWTFDINPGEAREDGLRGGGRELIEWTGCTVGEKRDALQPMHSCGERTGLEDLKGRALLITGGPTNNRMSERSAEREKKTQTNLMLCKFSQTTKPPTHTIQLFCYQ
mmetsp:Transcript_49904/g.150065  ORF Transcript_49904/g.150065 Transcript_49904/m.150065 type:complete len:137 (+) Transcript_49904:2250-2660(+)